MTVDAPAAVGSLWRRALAEAVGTGMLVAVVVGSGIAAQRLSADAGLQLLENSLATALALSVLIVLLAPVSEAHFNPVVSVVDSVLGRRGAGLPLPEVAVYVAAQTAGAVAGAMLANAMFDVTTSVSETSRATPGAFLAEIVATAGLVLVIVGLSRAAQPVAVVAASVGAYIGAAYWFTSSTSFANPAVTIGRIFTPTFAGIEPLSAVAFVGAQVVGGAVGAALAIALFPRDARR